MLQMVEKRSRRRRHAAGLRPAGHAGRIVTSDELLAKGPLALTFVRGTWCPYCSVALQALEEARPAIEAWAPS